jgi:hypothetical protein
VSARRDPEICAEMIGATLLGFKLDRDCSVRAICVNLDGAAIRPRTFVMSLWLSVQHPLTPICT